MSHTTSLEDRIQQQWDESNRKGEILFRSDTLTTRTVVQEGCEMHLIHNACRDSYDRLSKSGEKPIGNAVPFYDGSNPELVRTDGEQFKILGNTFSCLRYQSILVPVKIQEVVSIDFLETSLEFAADHPRLTLMYNAVNAGKTVPHQYWLLSFTQYKTLAKSNLVREPLGSIREISITRLKGPCYAHVFEVGSNVKTAAEVLYELTCYMGQKNFNVFLYANRVYFIPREDVEIPDGFENHRFGGLEMIGYFIMKSAEALLAAEPEALLGGIRQISYQSFHQHKLERYLLNAQRRKTAI